MSKTKTTLLASCAIFAVTTFGSYKLGFHYYRAGVETAPGQISYHDRAFMDDCARAKVASLLYDPVGVETWSRCQAVMDYYGTQPAFNRRLNLVAAFSGLSVISLIAFLWIVKYASKPPKVVRGREHFKGAKARRELKKISRKECKQSGQGIEFPLNIPMSLDRESRHFLAWGSTGAGKTTAMLLLMLGAIHRGDKVLILDTKGDLTSKLPYIGGVIAPHDAQTRCGQTQRERSSSPALSRCKTPVQNAGTGNLFATWYSPTQNDFSKSPRATIQLRRSFCVNRPAKPLRVF